ncbi:MAG: glycosyltransferase family 4 protein [Colwellia sp.]|nr:glycosyltransferase family 4 protein [Colwellia sp.]
MNIVILSTHTKGGGAFVAASNLANALNEYEGFKANIVSLNIDSSVIDKIRFLFCSILDRLVKVFLIKPINPIFHSSGVMGKYSSNEINKLGADLVIVHWFSNGLITPKQLSQINSPYVLHIHDSWLVCGFEHHSNEGFFSNNIFDRWLRKSKHEVIKNAKGIVFPSAWQRDVFFDRLTFIPKSQVTPNIVPFSPTNIIKDKNKLDNVVIGIVAHRIFENKAKGGEELIQTLQILNDKLIEYCLKVTFVIVGKKSRKMPQNCSNLSNIKINEIGVLRHNEMNLFFEGIDVFLNPSRFENLSTTNIEACSFGKPIICFDVGGNSSMVTDNFNGYLCKTYNCSSMSQGLFTLITNAERRKVFSRNSLLIFTSKFSSSIVLKQTISFYSECMLNAK